MASLRACGSGVYSRLGQSVSSMHNRDSVEEGLSLLGAQAGVALALDQDGCCAIGLDDGLSCVVEADEARGLAHLHVELLRLGSARRSAA